MDISVVLATRNRAHMLEPSVVSLCEQTLAPSRFEICIVDNNSTDNTVAVIDSLRKRYPSINLYIVSEPKIGLSHARNCGVANTTGEFIALTEDDAIAVPNWLELLLDRFATHGPDVAKVGGEIIPIWEGERPDWLDDGMLALLTATSGNGDKPKFCDYPLLEPGSAYRRTSLVNAGGFPTALGRQGNTLLSGEHIVDILMRMSGGKLYYDPSIILYHKIQANRLNPKWMRKRYFWQGVTDFCMRRYLSAHNIQMNSKLDIPLPLDVENWLFINDPDLPPTGVELTKLRGLAQALAMSGILDV